jgi:hypothetical protein
MCRRYRRTTGEEELARIYRIPIPNSANVGFKAHCAQIDFDNDPTMLGDLFEKLERLYGGAIGWQTAQRLGGFRRAILGRVCKSSM